MIVLFFISDAVCGGYEDMCEEPGGGGISKSQFFMTNETINMWNSGIVNFPFLFRNLTFSGVGNVDVTTMTDALSPKCSHADIVLRPETHLCTPSGNNHIDIKAQ